MAAPINAAPTASSIEAEMKAAAQFFKLKKSGFDTKTHIKNQKDEQQQEIEKVKCCFDELRKRQETTKAQVNALLQNVEKERPLEEQLKLIETLQNQRKLMHCNAKIGSNNLANCQTYLEDMSQNNAAMQSNLHELQEALKRRPPMSESERHLLNQGAKTSENISTVKF